MRTIYFAGSIRGGRDDAYLYKKLIDELSQYGEVLTEHVGDPELVSETNLSDKQIHDRDMEWLKRSDILVAEVTTPSLGVGYEIGSAVAMGKPVICLYRKEKNGKPLSAMIGGSDGADTYHYQTVRDIHLILRDILGSARNNS